ARLEEQLRGQAESLEQLRRDREQQAAQDDATEPAEAAAEWELAASAAAERRAEARLVAARLDADTLPARIERLRLELQAQELEDRWLQRRMAEVQAEYAQRSTEELRALTSDLQRLIEREPDVQQLYAGELA